MGVKFHPAGFYPFLKAPVSTLTNRVVDLCEILGSSGLLWKKNERLILSHQEKVNRAELFLLEHIPERDENVLLLRKMIDQIRDDSEILTVEHLVERVGLQKRTLQRLFNRYVGVNPKWVIQVYRLQQAAESLTQQKHRTTWVQLALDLGYSDQAHFIRDFKAVVGISPSAYVAGLDKKKPTPFRKV